MKDGEFTFTLTDHLGQAHTLVNTAEGAISLPEFTFREAGSYAFTLKEEAGMDKDTLYDSAVYTLNLTLAVNEENALAATEKAWARNGQPYLGDKPAFENTRKEAPVTDPPATDYPTIHVPLSARKVLRNGSLQAGDFTFELKDAKGTVLASARNAADGLVTFPARSFSREVSNYLYTMTERAGTDGHMRYDKTVYTVKVSTRAVNGQLIATVELLKDGVAYAGEMVFTNEKSIPPTGDSVPKAIQALAGLGLALGAGAFLLGKRRKTRKS